jgi:hypothetical protein
LLFKMSSRPSQGDRTQREALMCGENGGNGRWWSQLTIDLTYDE